MSTVDILQGDCRDLLKTLPSESVQCVVTSPPYLGLRSYSGGKQEVGTEATPDEYVQALVSIFREVKRVLRKDGTVWLNLADSYAANRGSGAMSVGPKQKTNVGSLLGPLTCPQGLKPKDLMGIPWRVALALQADGWWLRSDIIWSKGNAMPSSVTDRPTASHEYVFLLTKTERYFYDAAAIAEPSVHAGRVVKATGVDAKNASHTKRTTLGFTTHDTLVTATRNKRTVWQVNSKPFKGAHFAVMPEALVEPCILAGTSEKGRCPLCGAPWKRVTKKTGHINNREPAHVPGDSETKTDSTGWEPTSAATDEWRPTCSCGAPTGLLSDDLDVILTPTGTRAGDDPSLLIGRAGMARPRGDEEGARPITRYEQRRYAEQLRLSPNRAAMEREVGGAFSHYLRTDNSGARPIPEALLLEWIERGWLERVVVPTWGPPDPFPCVVLDPFAGAGTVGVVAVKNGRSAILMELNPEYCVLMENRLHGVQQRLPLA